MKLKNVAIIAGSDVSSSFLKELALAHAHSQKSMPLIILLSNGENMKIPTKFNHKGEEFTNADQLAIDKAIEKRNKKRTRQLANKVTWRCRAIEAYNELSIEVKGQ